MKLLVIALAILEIPLTTATTEQNCSTQERAAKLAFISHNLKLMNRKKYKKCVSYINNNNSHSPNTPNHENTFKNKNKNNLDLESYQSTNSLDLNNSSIIGYRYQ